jgi:hypothetical protein
MADLEMQQINPVTGAAPLTRIKDAASLNEVVKKIVARDLGSALARQDVQKMLDGAPPYEEVWLRESGQEGRCNLNFQDGKKEVRRKMLAYYDLTDSVPVLGVINSEFGNDINARARFNMIMSEELHRMIKDWPSFGTYFQLLVQKFCSHGLGFAYHQDDLDWKWYVAGLEDFKVPRGTSLAEEESDIAVCFRDVTAGKLYKWCFIDASPDDTRWDKQEVKEALLKASDSQLTFSVGAWEKYEQMLKNNDIWAASMAQDMVKLVHGWVVEYSGKVSHYVTLRNGGNKKFLFKIENRFDSVHQCFTFFPYEVGTNGTLHSVRGRAHEIYPQVQTLNYLRCNAVDNARLSGSLLLQPATPADEEDMAITFYGGAVYIPPNVKIQNGELNNPSQGMLPIVQDMSFMLHDEGIPQTPQGDSTTGDRKTKYQVQDDQAKTAVLDTAALTLFYEPWKRLLNETWRRVRNPRLKSTDPGGKEVFAMRKRAVARGVPAEALTDATSWIEPMRAIGYGSPGKRQLAYDRMMQKFGQLDPVGQNNLIRDSIAQDVGYAQVDRYVPAIDSNGRQPVDTEIAELQNTAMSAGATVTVLPNDHHILHLQSHQPNIETDLSNIESDQGDPQTLLQVVQTKIQHIAQHMQLLKPDALQKEIVAELTRRFNNEAERVQSAVVHAQRAAAKAAAEQAQAGGQPGQPPPPTKDQMDAATHGQKLQQSDQAHTQKMQHEDEKHQLSMKILQQDADQTRAIRDSEAASKLKAKTLPAPAA